MKGLEFSIKVQGEELEEEFNLDFRKIVCSFVINLRDILSKPPLVILQEIFSASIEVKPEYY